MRNINFLGHLFWEMIQESSAGVNAESRVVGKQIYLTRVQEQKDRLGMGTIPDLFLQSNF